MEFITLTRENLAQEHICCAIANNEDRQVAAKKSWLVEQLDNGLVFLKGDVRGKCFIEYMPAEKAWAPIFADGYMYINCLWVSGQFKGQGYSSQLLDRCMEDSKAKGKKGLVILSAKKKIPYLSDPKYLRYKGFQLADTAAPSFTLMYLPFDENAELPRFREAVKAPHIEQKGFVLYYTHQCPFTAKYVPLVENIAKEHSVPFQAIRLETMAQAQQAPSACTSYSLFYQGAFVTNEILSEKKFEKMLIEKGFLDEKS